MPFDWGALYSRQPQGALAVEPAWYERPVPRDPNYTYGSILPFRKPVGGGSAQWSPLYSEMVKGMVDAFTAPGRAGTMTQESMPYEAMNLAGNIQLASAGGLFGQGRLSTQPGTLGATAYHGSPHKFDKFSAEKIGTGEGAQAYGHGLYFAENPGVAKSYAQTLGGSKWVTVDPSVDKKVAELIPEAMKAHEKSPESAARMLLAKAKEFDDIISRGDGTAVDTTLSARYKEGAAAILAGKAKVSTPNLYKVDIPDEHIAKMLDWDKPLSQQPESVRKAISTIQAADPTFWGPMGDIRGETLMRMLSNRSGGAYEKASAALREAGIPGIRYLDQGSRAGGQGTSNYVVFDPELVKILERK